MCVLREGAFASSLFLLDERERPWNAASGLAGKIHTHIAAAEVERARGKRRNIRWREGAESESSRAAGHLILVIELRIATGKSKRINENLPPGPGSFCISWRS